MNASPSPSPSGPLFLQKSWFELLLRHGMKPAHGHVIIEVAGATLNLLCDGRIIGACANFYSPYFDFQDGQRPDAEDTRLLASKLEHSGIDQLMLRPLRGDDSFWRVLHSALEKNGFVCDELEIGANWYLPCHDLSWADYLAQRPSRLRNTLRRTRKKLAEHPGFRVEIVKTSGAPLEQAIRDYGAVYASSWKEPEPFPDFIPALCRLAAQQNCLRLGVLYLDGSPAAAQIWIVTGGTAAIYKLAYDARFARLGVGTVLTAELFAHALDVDKVAEIDFLTGDDGYKAEWMTACRPLVALIAFNKRSIGGLARAARHFLPRWFKRKIGRR